MDSFISHPNGKKINDIMLLTAKLQTDIQFVSQWLKASISVHNNNGSAAFCSRLKYPIKLWSPPYPETTGYLLPTLEKLYLHTEDNEYKEMQIKCMDWLASIQRYNGAFPSLYAANDKISIFNTGQILLGFCQSSHTQTSPKFEIVIKNAAQFLLDQLINNQWKKHNFTPDFVPSYYSRVLWPLLLYYKIYSNKYPQVLYDQLNVYRTAINKNLSINNWAFSSDEPAYTHTIAYCIRGNIESGILTKDSDIIQKTILIYNKLHKIKLQNGKTAGSFTQDWGGNYSFSCITGLLQLALCGFRLYEHLGEQAFLNHGITYLGEAASLSPYSGTFWGKKGGIAGSYPIYGSYQKFKFPNWAAKFYVDAVLKFIDTCKTAKENPVLT